MRFAKNLSRGWMPGGVQEAANAILGERNTLFDDVVKNLENNKELHDFIHSLLIEGDAKRYVINDPVIDAGVRYGFLSNAGGRVAVSNRIFELLMTDYFITL